MVQKEDVERIQKIMDNCHNFGDKIGQKVIWEARKKSVIIRPLGDVIVLMPPLAIDRPTLEELVDVTYESIKIVTGS